MESLRPCENHDDVITGIATVGARLDGVQERMSALENSLARKFDSIDSRLESMPERVARSLRVETEHAVALHEIRAHRQTPDAQPPSPAPAPAPAKDATEYAKVWVTLALALATAVSVLVARMGNGDPVPPAPGAAQAQASETIRP